MTACSSSVLFLLSIFFLQPFSSVTENLAFISQTCKQCMESSPGVFYSFCVASLQADPESGAEGLDLRGLGIIAAKLAFANATYTREYITRQLKDNSTSDPSTWEACIAVYDMAIDYLTDAQMSLLSMSYAVADFELSGAMGAPKLCEAKLDGLVPPPLRQGGADLFQLSAIGLAITRLCAKT